MSSSHLQVDHTPSVQAVVSDLVDLVDEHGGRFVERFTLHSQVGRGASTCVYVARHIHGHEAACKLARCQPRMRWSRVVKTFQREALLLQRCVHPHIIEYHGLYLGRTEAALVLSLAPGGDCQQLLLRHGALSEGTARTIVSQLCTALDCMHRVHRIVHRDVKLENLLVCEIHGRSGCPTIKLCDFGHSCLLDQPLNGVAVNDGFKGTEGYAAPEVAAGGTWSAAADVWSVGVVFYALLANELLRWKAAGIPEISTKTSRAFAQVSTLSKMAIKAILLPEGERTTLPNVLTSLQQQDTADEPQQLAVAGGLRRSMGSRAYSHMDLTSLSRTSAVLQPGASQDSASSMEPSLDATPLSSPEPPKRLLGYAHAAGCGAAPSTLMQLAPSTPSQPSQPMQTTPLACSAPVGAGSAPFGGGGGASFCGAASGGGIPLSFGPTPAAFSAAGGAGVPLSLGPTPPGGAGIPFGYEQQSPQAGIPFTFEQSPPAGIPFAFEQASAAGIPLPAQSPHA